MMTATRPCSLTRDRESIAKVGLGGHDVARAAVEEDVAGISIPSGAHLTLLPAVRYLLDEAGAGDIRLIAGSVIPQEDIAGLARHGVDHVFLSGTPVEVIVDYIRSIGTKGRDGGGDRELG